VSVQDVRDALEAKGSAQKKDGEAVMERCTQGTCMCDLGHAFVYVCYIYIYIYTYVCMYEDAYSCISIRACVCVHLFCARIGFVYVLCMYM